jgi:hypothetical protein
MDAPRLLILIHIPKTAGTTLSHMLRMRFALRPANWLRHARTLGYYHLGYARPEHLEARLARIAALSPRQRSQVRFFAAHAGFGLRERLPDDLRATAGYITVLRDPVARVISTFHHLRSEGRLPRDLNLRNYIDQRRHFGLFKFDNAQTRYLAGEGGVAIDDHAHRVTRDMLELAKQRLEHDIWWFGLTERFEESVLMLADLLRWKRPQYVSARVTKSRGDEQPPETALLAKIREINALDVELYEHAARLFEQRLASQPPDFADRLARLRHRNARGSALLAPIARTLPAARLMLQRAGVLR